MTLNRSLSKSISVIDSFNLHHVKQAAAVLLNLRARDPKLIHKIAEVRLDFHTLLVKKSPACCALNLLLAAVWCGS